MFKRWQDARDQAARDFLLERFTPLARKLARRYLGANEPFEDLMQVATVGLLLAIDRFDCERGTAFSSFAVPTILGELKRYFRDLGWAVHVPRAAQERALQVDAAEQHLRARQGRSPSIMQIAELLEWPAEDVVAALEARAAHHTTSLQLPKEDVDGEYGEFIDAFGHIDESYELVDARLSIAEALQHLSASERRVLYMRLVTDLTQAEIGARLGLSQMQVSRLQRGSLERVKEMINRPQ